MAFYALLLAMESEIWNPEAMLSGGPVERFSDPGTETTDGLDLCGFEESEVRAVLDSLIGPRSPDKAWHAHLASRQRLLAETTSRIADMRAALTAAMYAEPGASYATVANRLGLSRPKIQQMIERDRAARGQ